jgi:RNA polymerase sigma-70 factor (ECF subfamily)
MTIVSDEELVTRCKKELPANTHSYEVLVQRHMDRVYYMAYRVVGNKEEAEEIAQDVFLKAYHGLKTFEQRASFSTWLYRITTNRALDSLEKTRRHSETNVRFFGRAERKDETAQAGVTALRASSESHPETQIIQRELRECIQRVLKTLDREQARLLIMRDYDDRSYDEIAQMLQAGLSAVKMRIHRARLAFQQLFSQFCGSFHFSFTASERNARKNPEVQKE